MSVMDVLSDVLRVVRLSGAVFFVAEFSSPWAIESPSSKSLASLIMPRAECFTIFHVLAEGHCWVKVKGEPAIPMTAGDVLVVPQGDQHVMGSDLALKPTALSGFYGELRYSITIAGERHSALLYGGEFRTIVGG